MRRSPFRAALFAFLVTLSTAGAARGAVYRAGVTTLTFTKTSVTSGMPRVLETVVWYPAAPRTGTREALGLRDAAIRRGPFPLLVFSHGSCGSPTESTYLATALARHGFVVAAPPHPGNTQSDFPACLAGANFIDSAINRVPDVRFVIDAMLGEAATPGSRFFGKLRADAIGLYGLSFGGFTALLGAVQEPRLRAALSLVPGGIEVLGANRIGIPTMVIGAERDLIVGFPASEVAYERLDGPRFLVELLAANHLSVVDDCEPFCVPEDITQEEAHRLVLDYALPFFRHYVGGRPRPRGRLDDALPGVNLQAELEPR